MGSEKLPLFGVDARIAQSRQDQKQGVPLLDVCREFTQRRVDAATEGFPEGTYPVGSSVLFSLKENKFVSPPPNVPRSRWPRVDAQDQTVVVYPKPGGGFDVDKTGKNPYAIRESSHTEHVLRRPQRLRRWWKDKWTGNHRIRNIQNAIASITR